MGSPRVSRPDVHQSVCEDHKNGPQRSLSEGRFFSRGDRIRMCPLGYGLAALPLASPPKSRGWVVTPNLTLVDGFGAGEVSSDCASGPRLGWGGLWRSCRPFGGR